MQNEPILASDPISLNKSDAKIWPNRRLLHLMEFTDQWKLRYTITQDKLILPQIMEIHVRVQHFTQTTLKTQRKMVR